MKLILSTSNIMRSSPSSMRRPFFEKSNTELTTSLQTNITSHKTALPASWTTRTPSALYIPTHTPSPLTEPRDAYDITVKLFYLPTIPASQRGAHTREAIELVLAELGTTSIDLLIVSFPGISFDADDDDDSDGDDTPAPSIAAEDGEDVAPEDIETMVATWRDLEALQTEGLVQKLGIAEFGVARLSRFLEGGVRVRPSVNQINVRDCCVVPKPLILYAKERSIELLTHNDCTNILPRGTLRQILGSGDHDGTGVLVGEKGADALRADVVPQWVVKYTAVVQDRGVVESKGYFAVAELKEE